MKEAPSCFRKNSRVTLTRIPGTFVWNRLLWNFRLGSSARKLSFGVFATVAWDMSLGSFALEYFALKRSIENVRSGTFVLDLSLRNFPLGSFVSELPFVIFR